MVAPLQDGENSEFYVFFFFFLVVVVVVIAFMISGRGSLGERPQNPRSGDDDGGKNRAVGKKCVRTVSRKEGGQESTFWTVILFICR